jgi:hypothetical protein
MCPNRIARRPSGRLYGMVGCRTDCQTPQRASLRDGWLSNRLPDAPAGLLYPDIVVLQFRSSVGAYSYTRQQVLGSQLLALV